MRFIGLILLILIWPLSTYSGEFKIGEYRRYGSENYLELFRLPHGGESFEHIMTLIEPSHDDFAIRILSPLTDEAKDEIMTYYKNKIPKELDKALSSSGNLHNPALDSLLTNFAKALETTELFHEFEALISDKGYRITKVEFEKFTLHVGELFVAEITLKCKKET